MSDECVQYLVRQPTSLESLSLEKFGEWIAAQPEKFLVWITLLPEKSEKWNAFQLKQQTAPKTKLMYLDPMKTMMFAQLIENIRCHLECKLPGKFHDKLAEIIIKSISKYAIKHESYNPSLGFKDLRPVEMEVKGWMIESIYTKSVTTLSFPEWINTYSMVQSTFYSKSYMLTGLTHLDLQCKLKEDHIIQLLQELKQLKYLNLPVLCSNDILLCIKENCKLIEELVINYSDIDDESMYSLIMLHNLKSIELYLTKVSEKGIKLLLMSCKELEHIGTNINIITVLKCIASLKENAKKWFKLKTYNDHYCESPDDNATDYDIEIIIKLCPLLQHVSVIDAHNIIALKNAKFLRELKLTGFGFYTDHIAELLKIKGSLIECLHLNYVTEIDFNALMHTIHMCSNLECLTISGALAIKDFYFYDIDMDDIQPLRNLKRLTLEQRATCPLFTEKEVFFILSNCPNLEFIEVLKIGMLTDSVILKILDKNPKHFMYLKQLIIGKNGMKRPKGNRVKVLSKFVLDRIVENCINPPNIEVYYD